MNRFSLGRVGAAGTDETPAIEIINSSTTKPAWIKKVTATLIAATATDIGLGYPAAAGITPTSPIALLAENARDIGLVTTAVAWATAPTIPAAYLRIGGAPATIGIQIEFVFEGKGLYLAPLATLILWNRTTSSQLNITVEAEQATEAVANS